MDQQRNVFLRRVSKEHVVKVQTQTFVRWANKILRPRHMKITNLSKDVETGILLIYLSADAFKVSVPRHNKNPKNKIQKINNVQIAFDLLQENGVRTQILNAMAIVEGKTDQILAIMWNTIVRYQVVTNSKLKQDLSLDEEDLTGNKTEIVENKLEQTSIKEEDPAVVLLKWINESVELPEGKKVTNFKQDWMDGQIIASLVDSFDLDANLIDFDTKNSLALIKQALRVAKNIYGIPSLISAEVIHNGLDNHSLITYLGELRNECENGFPIKKQMEEERQKAVKIEHQFVRETTFNQLKNQLFENFAENPRYAGVFESGSSLYNKEEFDHDRINALKDGFLLGKLLESVVQTPLEISEEGENWTKIKKYLDKVGYDNLEIGLEDDKIGETILQVFDIISATSEKSNQELLSWINKKLKTEIPIESLHEFISSGQLFGEFVNILIEENLLAENNIIDKVSLVEQNNEVLVQSTLDKLDEILKTKTQIFASDLIKFQSESIARKLLSELNGFVRANSSNAHWNELITWLEDFLDEKIEGEDIINNESFMNGDYLISILKKIDPSLDDEYIRSLDKDKKMEVLQNILLNKYKIQAAMKLNKAFKTSKSDFAKVQFEIVSHLKAEAENGFENFIVENEKEEKQMKENLVNSMAEQFEDVDDNAFSHNPFSSVETTKGLLDMMNCEYEEDEITDLMRDEERATKFIEILNQNKIEISFTPHELLNQRKDQLSNFLLSILENEIIYDTEVGLNVRDKRMSYAKIIDKEISKEMLLKKVNEMVSPYSSVAHNLPVDNFRSKWYDGAVLCAFVDAAKPGVLPESSWSNATVEERIFMGLEKAKLIGAKRVPTQKIMVSGICENQIEFFVVDVLKLMLRNKLETKTAEFLSSSFGENITSLRQFIYDNIDKNMLPLGKIIEKITSENIGLNQDDGFVHNYETVNEVSHKYVGVKLTKLSLFVKREKTTEFSHLKENEEFLTMFSEYLINVYKKSLKKFPVKSRLLRKKEKVAKEEENKLEELKKIEAENESSLNKLQVLSQSDLEPEKNVAGYNVQFTITARGKNKKDREDGGHIKAIVKGPFPLNLSKQYKLIKPKNVKIEQTTRLDINDYQCNYVPSHQGIYIIRIYIYKRETPISPIYFAITSKGGFWLKVNSEGQIETTDHDVLRQEDFKKRNLKKQQKGIEKWKEGQAEKEAKYREEKTKVMLDQELQKIKEVDALNNQNLEGTLTKTQLNKRNQILNDFNETAIKNFLTIMKFGFKVKLFKKTLFGLKNKDTVISVKETDGRFVLGEIDVNNEIRKVLTELLPHKSVILGEVEEIQPEKHKDIDLKTLVKLEVKKKPIIFSFESEEYKQYFIRVMELVIKKVDEN